MREMPSEGPGGSEELAYEEGGPVDPAPPVVGDKGSPGVPVSVLCLDEQGEPAGRLRGSMLWHSWDVLAQATWAWWWKGEGPTGGSAATRSAAAAACPEPPTPPMRGDTPTTELGSVTGGPAGAVALATTSAGGSCVDPSCADVRLGPCCEPSSPLPALATRCMLDERTMPPPELPRFTDLSCLGLLPAGWSVETKEALLEGVPPMLILWRPELLSRCDALSAWLAVIDVRLEGGVDE
mmetsp:Transcript_28191/g.71876  ORF Transcript_28191/g.71876 Transcript_28191/m.71876 type:complete len:238 (-) Transcript_28191:810-1523(-)